MEQREIDIDGWWGVFNEEDCLVIFHEKREAELWRGNYDSRCFYTIKQIKRKD